MLAKLNKQNYRANCWLRGFTVLVLLIFVFSGVAWGDGGEAFVNGKAAATRKKVGKGSVIKLAFWPKDDSIVKLMRQFVPVGARFRVPVLAGVQVVPRSDGSMFFINTTSKPAIIKLAKAAVERISGRELGGDIR